MTKDRKIDDAELENISGAGTAKELAESGSGSTGGFDNADGTKPPTGGGGGGGNPGGIEHDAETTGDQEFGPR